MTRDELLELYKDLPETVGPSIIMSEANAPLKIYEGDFLLKNKHEEITFNGNIYFNWVASTGSQFIGEIKEDSLGFRYSAMDSYSIIIDGLELGEGFVTNTNIGPNLLLKGILSGETVLGDRSVPVEKIIFSIPNFRDIHGMPTKRITPE